MTPRVRHAELWGKRQAKYDWLNTQDAASTPWKSVAPTPPLSAPRGAIPRPRI